MSTTHRKLHKTKRKKITATLKSPVSPSNGDGNPILVPRVPSPKPQKTTSFLVTDADDEPLVVSAQHGSEPAFNTLIHRHRPDAYKLAHRILYKPGGRINAPQSADDVIQEACIRAWKHIRSCNPPANFRVWFRGIVRNECKMLFRDLAKDFVNIDIYTDIDSIEDNTNWMVSTAVIRPVDVGTPSSEEPKISLEREELKQDLEFYRKAVAELPAQQRKVFMLKADGYTYKEIGKALRMPTLTVGSNLNYARKKLKNKLENTKIE